MLSVSYRFRPAAGSEPTFLSWKAVAAAAFFRAHFLNQTCSADIRILSIGHDLRQIDPRKLTRYPDQMARAEHYNYQHKA